MTFNIMGTVLMNLHAGIIAISEEYVPLGVPVSIKIIELEVGAVHSVSNPFKLNSKCRV